MEVTKQTSWVLPLIIEARVLEIKDHRVEDLIQFHVITRDGNPAGPRLLRGNDSPFIEEWGPFGEFENAEKLKNRLTAHIRKEEEKKLKRKGRKK
jgi:hypothetical protein